MLNNTHTQNKTIYLKEFVHKIHIIFMDDFFH